MGSLCFYAPAGRQQCSRPICRQPLCDAWPVASPPQRS